jgi:predicted phosphodiesterase
MFNTLCHAALLALLLQHQPFPVHDAKPVILNGPYILAPTETSATIVWTTDTPSHSKVLYGTNGALDKIAEPQQHGLIPIGTKHSVTIEGLQPGTAYQYKAVSTRVVKMKSYWPEKGLDAESPVRTFTTFDRKKPSFSFAVITDTHADLARIAALLKLIDWTKTDFLVHVGDAFDTENEEMIWSRWLDPLSSALAGAKPLLYARGNHETRGASARALMDHVPIPEGRFYYARNHGPAHLIFLDTGEDKPDDTNVYARLNAFKRYKEQEYAWFENHLRTEPAVKSAPFRILLMHAPNWGWTDNQSAKWTQLANQARIDLSISGHTHRFADVKPGEKDNAWRQLVIAPDQLARVEVSARELSVTVLSSKDGATVTTFTLTASPAAP